MFALKLFLGISLLIFGQLIVRLGIRMVEKSLDLKGLGCPIPVLKANKAIRKLEKYDVIVCEVSDPAAPADFKDFCKSSRYSLLSCEQRNDIWVIKIEK